VRSRRYGSVIESGRPGKWTDASGFLPNEGSSITAFYFERISNGYILGLPKGGDLRENFRGAISSCHAEQ
jgi:hypothetical protein